MKINNNYSVSGAVDKLKMFPQGVKSIGEYLIGPLSKDYPFADLVARVSILMAIAIAGLWIGYKYHQRQKDSSSNNRSLSPPIQPSRSEESESSQSSTSTLSPPAPVVSLPPAEPFHFAELPEDMQILIINKLGSQANLQDIRHLAETSRNVFRLVFSHQIDWRQHYLKKYGEVLPQILRNPFLTGFRSLRWFSGWFSKLRKMELRSSPCSEIPMLCPDTEIVRKGAIAINAQLIPTDHANTFQLLVNGLRRGIFSCLPNSFSALSRQNEHAILANQTTAYIFTDDEAHILFYDRTKENIFWHKPQWARCFNELQICNSFIYHPDFPSCPTCVCVGLKSQNVNGDHYTYYIINLSQPIPLGLERGVCPEFYFDEGKFPVTFFNHPFIANKLFFYSHDPDQNKAIYLLDLWTDVDAFKYYPIINHNATINHASFSSDGLQLIVRDSVATTAYSFIDIRMHHRRCLLRWIFT